MKAKEMIMKCSIARTFTMAAVTALALGIAPTAKADDKGCSNATLQGTFAYTATGWINFAVAEAYAETGAQTFDGQGVTGATAAASQNGIIFAVTITGTYTVNPDCTGTFTLQFYPKAQTVHFFFVIDDSGNGFQAIQTDPGFVITRIGRRLVPGRVI